MQAQELVIDRQADEPEIVRDERGRIRKGSGALNPQGAADRRLIVLKRKLDGLTERAIARLGRLVESDNETVALGAVREVLDRNLGKAKATVQVDVTQTHVLHLQALEEIAERKRNQLLASQTIDAVAVQHDGETGSIIPVMRNAAQHNESGAVEPPRTPLPPGAAAVAPPATHTEEK
jgi:hypothetical protein